MIGPEAAKKFVDSDIYAEIKATFTEHLTLLEQEQADQIEMKDFHFCRGKAFEHRTFMHGFWENLEENLTMKEPKIGEKEQ